ncbi:efflux RND transporter periplasmic adaptor subunit [Rubrivivax rivuli]|uniref:Efflux RND transporter periplasmic adaptor subunit n=2 Tax=Rubrivivax rivuli TaxID=1862385 RepID=A0A437RFV5_9BURK|nr:efflux RND transporter periplasmic adaptor subunit [Rubrivivax rivuli]
MWGASLGAVVLAGASGAWVAGVFKPGAKPPAAAAQAAGKEGKDGKHGKDGKKPETPLEFAAREVVQPVVARLPVVVEFSGPLVAPQTATVRARASGTLLALNVAEGSRVVAGQVIGRIELADLASRVAERSAMLESARAALAQAERTHASNESLAAQKFISPNALESSAAALATARAQLNAAQASLDTTRVGLRDATLVAPIAGIVAKRHAVPGEKLSVEQQVLSIVDLARLELAGSVGTHEVSRIAPGLAVQVQVEGMDKPVAGRVARIAPAAEAGTRSIGVTIELANPQERLRAGQYALARATLNDEAERLTLPDSAVGSTSGQDHVWVIENGTLARRAVTLGRRDPRAGRVEVLQGVTPASQVLAARFDNLREGAKASVAAAKGSGTAAAVASAAASAPLVK